MSFCATAMVAATRAVMPPIQAIIESDHGEASASTGFILVSR